MDVKRYLAVVLVLALVLSVLPGMTSAQYEQVLIDEEGDVLRIDGDSHTPAHRPNVDISQVAVSESGGVITVSLTVVGTITDQENLSYMASLIVDEYSVLFLIYENGDGIVTMNFFESVENSTVGSGTSTLSFMFTLEDIGDPESLILWSAMTMELVEEGGSDVMYQDFVFNDDYDPGYPEEPFFMVEIVSYDDTVLLGDTVTVVYEIENIGLEPDTQDIVFLVDYVIEDSFTNLYLGPGDFFAGTFTWTPADPGTYILEVESDDYWDWVMVTVTDPDAPEGPFFKVEITSYDDTILLGDTLYMDYEIENIGQELDTQDIVIYVDGLEVERDSFTIHPEATWGRTFIWTPVETGTYSITVESDDDSDSITVTVTEDGDVPELPEFELVISVEGEGTTNPEEGIHHYGEDHEVTVIATPSHGWKFIEWTGDASGTSTTISIFMDGNKSVTAVFEEDPVGQFHLSIGIQGEGTTNPSEGNHNYNDGAHVNIIAAPADGWRFVEWTGDASGTSTSLTITMDGDKSVTAVFEEIDDDTVNGDDQKEDKNNIIDDMTNMGNMCLLIGLIVVIIIVVVLILVLRKRKNKGKEHEGYSPPGYQQPPPTPSQTSYDGSYQNPPPPEPEAPPQEQFPQMGSTDGTE